MVVQDERAIGMQLTALFWGKERASVWEEEDESQLVGLTKKDLKGVTAELLRELKVIQ